MNKIIVILMSLLITSSLVVGYNSNNEEEMIAGLVTVNVGAADGLLVIAIAKLSQENSKVREGYEVKYIFEATSDALSTDVMKENLDIAIVPSNMASIAYNILYCWRK